MDKPLKHTYEDCVKHETPCNFKYKISFKYITISSSTRRQPCIEHSTSGRFSMLWIILPIYLFTYIIYIYIYLFTYIYIYNLQKSKYRKVATCKFTGKIMQYNRSIIS